MLSNCREKPEGTSYCLLALENKKREEVKKKIYNLLLIIIIIIKISYNYVSRRLMLPALVYCVLHV